MSPTLGEKTMQCGGCLAYFYGLGAFDHHRRGGECTDPEELDRLQIDDRGRWRLAR